MKNVTLANGTVLNLETSEVTIKKEKIKSAKVNGFILYQGPSVLDGAQIAVIATLNTANEKTGNMVQTWIIRQDVTPLEATKQGLDSSVCGMCPHRHYLKGACYVQTFQAPRAVYNAYKADKYPSFDYNNKLHINSLAGRFIRLGAYGDPAAVPVIVWQNIVKLCSGHTGYTHQIHHKNFNQEIAELCMISADTLKDAQKAHKKGFKTFRVKTEKMIKSDNEIICLSDSKGISCIDCGLCSGKNSSVNIVIDIHGARKNRFDKFERII